MIFWVEIMLIYFILPFILLICLFISPKEFLLIFIVSAILSIVFAIINRKKTKSKPLTPDEKYESDVEER